MYLHIVQKHLDEKSITGQLLRNTIEQRRNYTRDGFRKICFLQKYEKYSLHVTDCWVKHLWEYVDENNITIQDEVTGKLQLQRANDKLIMESMINRGNFKRKELQIINSCKIFL